MPFVAFLFNTEKYFAVVTRSGSAHVSQNTHVHGHILAAVLENFWGVV